MSTTAPVAAAAPRALPPLQDRTPEQLKAGLHVGLTGAQGPEGLRLGRLMQDAADWTAAESHTVPSLATVTLHDKKGDQNHPWLSKLPFIGSRFEGFQAWSNFNDAGQGHFQLSDSQSNILEQGFARLRETPIGAWSEVDRNDFAEVNATILHELNHLTLKNYSAAQIGAWNSEPLGIEESLAEFTSVAAVPAFMQAEYGVKIGAFDTQLQNVASVYTPYTARLKRLFDAAGRSSVEDALAGARELTGGVDVDARARTLAQMIATHVAGDKANPKTVAALADAIPGYIEEKHSMTVMELIARLRDERRGAASVPRA